MTGCVNPNWIWPVFAHGRLPRAAPWLARSPRREPLMIGPAGVAATWQLTWRPVWACFMVSGSGEGNPSGAWCNAGAFEATHLGEASALLDLRTASSRIDSMKRPPGFGDLARTSGCRPSDIAWRRCHSILSLAPDRGCLIADTAIMDRLISRSRQWRRNVQARQRAMS